MTNARSGDFLPSRGQREAREPRLKGDSFAFAESFPVTQQGWPIASD